MVKNDEYYVQKIIDDLSFVVENTKDVTIDEMVYDAVNNKMPIMLKELLDTKN